jgi:hypothetical protein
MYNSKHNVTTDSLGSMVRKYDKSSKRTTLINDEVRVYKGGSWRDILVRSCSTKILSSRYGNRLHWFRCAMSKVGPKKEKKNKKLILYK